MNRPNIPRRPIGLDREIEEAWLELVRNYNESQLEYLKWALYKVESEKKND